MRARVRAAYRLADAGEREALDEVPRAILVMALAWAERRGADDAATAALRAALHRRD